MSSGILAYAFIRNALASCVLASVVCAVIGVMATERRMLMMAGGVAHTAYGGVGLGLLLGFEPLAGALGFSVLAALAIGAVSRRRKERSEVAIGLLWSLGMALGLLFTALMDGCPPDMTGFLFGDILSVTGSDLALMAVLAAVVVLSVAVFFDDWRLFLFDEEFARVSGLRTAAMDYGLLVLVALSSVILIRTTGIVLAIALLSAPAASAALLARTFKGRMALALAFALAFCLAGLALSFWLDIPSGAAIVVVAACSFGALEGLGRVKGLARKKRGGGRPS